MEGRPCFLRLAVISDSHWTCHILLILICSACLRFHLPTIVLFSLSSPFDP